MTEKIHLRAFFLHLIDTPIGKRILKQAIFQDYNQYHIYYLINLRIYKNDLAFTYNVHKINLAQVFIPIALTI